MTFHLRVVPFLSMSGAETSASCENLNHRSVVLIPKRQPVKVGTRKPAYEGFYTVGVVVYKL